MVLKGNNHYIAEIFYNLRYLIHIYNIHHLQIYPKYKLSCKSLYSKYNQQWTTIGKVIYIVYTQKTFPMLLIINILLVYESNYHQISIYSSLPH